METISWMPTDEDDPLEVRERVKAAIYDVRPSLDPYVVHAVTYAVMHRLFDLGVMQA